MTAYPKIRLGVLVISDRAFKGVYQDRSGKIITQTLQRLITNPFVVTNILIPDEKKRIASNLRQLCDKKKCSLVITTGGTGPGMRDVTPEATIAVCQKLLPGFGEVMRHVSMRQTPTAILSRQTAGIRGKTLIINLPGSPKAIAPCLDSIADALADCLKVLGGPDLIYRKKQSNINHH